jgi:hypothetical protein
VDWILSISTLLANGLLGWSRGAVWAWACHILNSILWIAYALVIKQYGLIVVGLGTVIIDVPLMYKAYRRDKNESLSGAPNLGT